MAYTSQATSPENQISTDLEDIVQVSKLKNKVSEITGVLFYDNRQYFQLIEGEYEVLLQLMDKIRQDARHRDINMIIDQAVEKREFSSWNMDYFNISKSRQMNEDMLDKFRNMYQQNLKMNARVFVELMKEMLAEPEVLKFMKD
jgi:GTP-binding protein EngB required for normal cell division